MKKGKFGVCLWFYAVLAFVLAFLGQILLGALLLGFVIATEKDEWLTRQTIEALCLSIFSSVVGGVFSLLNQLVSPIPFVGSTISTVFSWVEWLVSVAVLVFVIIGIVQTAKGKDAPVPGFSALAYKAVGMMKPKPVYQQPQYQAPVNGQYPQYQAPANNNQPQYQAPQYQQPPVNNQPQNPNNQ